VKSQEKKVFLTYLNEFVNSALQEEVPAAQNSPEEFLDGVDLSEVFNGEAYHTLQTQFGLSPDAALHVMTNWFQGMRMYN
jgi:hypothetical protein